MMFTRSAYPSSDNQRGLRSSSENKKRDKLQGEARGPVKPRRVVAPCRSDVSKQNDESLPIRKGAILLAPAFVDIGHHYACAVRKTRGVLRRVVKGPHPRTVALNLFRFVRADNFHVVLHVRTFMGTASDIELIPINLHRHQLCPRIFSRCHHSVDSPPVIVPAGFDDRARVGSCSLAS
jgi:hypothetical protein